MIMRGACDGCGGSLHCWTSSHGAEEEEEEDDEIDDDDEWR